MAFLEFFLAATRAGIVTAYIFKGVTHRLLVAVVAMWTMHVTVIVSVVVLMIMVAVRAVNVIVLSHAGYSGM